MTGKAENLENAVYDLKAVNPHNPPDADTRTPAELLDLIEAKGREMTEALAVLRSIALTSLCQGVIEDNHSAPPMRGVASPERDRTR